MNLPRQYQTNKGEAEAGTQLTPVGGHIGRRSVTPGGVEKPLIRYVNMAFQANDTTLTPILGENRTRIYLNVQNQGGINIFVSFGERTAGLLISPGNGFEWNINPPQNSIYVYTAGGPCNCILIEGAR